MWEHIGLWNENMMISVIILYREMHTHILCIMRKVERQWKVVDVGNDFKLHFLSMSQKAFDRLFFSYSSTLWSTFSNVHFYSHFIYIYFQDEFFFFYCTFSLSYIKRKLIIIILLNVKAHTLNVKKELFITASPHFSSSTLACFCLVSFMLLTPSEIAFYFIFIRDMEQEA